MKQIELHAHIEGTVPVGALIYLIKKNRTKEEILPDYLGSYRKETFHTLYDMIDGGSPDVDLERYLSRRLVLNAPAPTLLEFIRRLPSRSLKYLVRNEADLVYVIDSTLSLFGDEYERVELIFCPKSLENEWLSDDEIVDVFSRYWQGHANKEKFSFLLSLRRTEVDVSPEYVTKVVNDYSQYYDKGIPKLDVCADEDAVSYKEIAESLDILVNAKQEVTLHLGETTGRDIGFILENYPSIKQFNHGIQAAFDANLLRQIKEADILLTVCPLSNIYTGVLTEAQIFTALGNLKNAGVRYAICSDDATIINGDVSAPYKYLREKAPELIPELEV